MKSTAKRILSFLLIAALLLPLSACGKTEENRAEPESKLPDVSEVAKEPTAEELEAQAYTQFTEEKADRSTNEYVTNTYAGYDYDGYAFRILSMTPGEHYLSFVSSETSEIWYPEDNADVQIHTVFERNILTEELLNVKIEPLFAGNTYETPERCQTLVKAGGDDFDMMYGAQFKTLLLAMENYFLNLYDLGTFDPTNEWWDRQYVDTFTIQNSKIYTITGDYLMMDEMAGEVLFYNNQIIENNHFTDPADLVEQGKWTIDAMMEMAEAVTYDSDGDGQMTREDNWGVYDNWYAIVHFLEGCDIHMTEIGEDGLPVVIIEDEKFINAVQYVFDKIIMSPATLLGEGDHNTDLLQEDRVLFNYDQMGVIFRLREMEGDFGLLPMPKLNEEQEKYTSVVNGIWCTTLSVPITATNTERIGVIMDVLGGFSTDTVDNAIDEVLLGTKLIRQKRSRDMLRYIVDSREYDWAKDIKWGYPIYNLIIEQSDTKTFTLASGLRSKIKLIKAELKRFTLRVK